MTWVDPGTMLLDVDKPARSVDITGIANNFEAMANGDAGAPKIMPAALDVSVSVLETPTHGTTARQKSLGSIDLSTIAGGGLAGILKIDEGSVSFTPVANGDLTATLLTKNSLAVAGLVALELITINFSGGITIVETNFNTAAISAGGAEIIDFSSTVIKGTSYFMRVKNGVSPIVTGVISAEIWAGGSGVSYT